uniref:Uncharacterized protein n=1 Tax=Triticum urartu TaxID=4572 RepID=A0A8R7THQ5_TRIUA
MTCGCLAHRRPKFQKSFRKKCKRKMEQESQSSSPLSTWWLLVLKAQAAAATISKLLLLTIMGEGRCPTAWMLACSPSVAAFNPEAVCRRSLHQSRLSFVHCSKRPGQKTRSSSDEPCPNRNLSPYLSSLLMGT